MSTAHQSPFDSSVSGAPTFGGEDNSRLRYAVQRVGGVPTVSVRLWIRGGARLESSPGLSAVTGRMLSEGTRSRDWHTLASDFEGRGMALSSLGSLAAHGLTIDALADDWERALAWAAELVFECQFPEERHRWIVSQAAAELESLSDQPETVTSWAFRDQLYHPHPAARPNLGSAKALEQQSTQDCEAFHRGGLERGVVMAVAGRIDPELVAGAIERYFGEHAALRGDASPGEQPPEPVGRPVARHEVTTRGDNQVQLYAGHLTVPLAHQDVPALSVAGVVLGAGSGLSGRIPMRIREEEGLAYSAQAATVAGAGLDPGRLVVYLGTSPETADRAEALLRTELERFVSDGPTELEVKEGLAYLLGREAFLRETGRQWADSLADSLFYDLPLWRSEWRRARYEALDVEAVTVAVRRHLDVSRLHVTRGVGG